MSDFIQSFIDLFYQVDENGNPELVKTFIALFAFVVITYLVLECFYLLRSAQISLK